MVSAKDVKEILLSEGATLVGITNADPIPEVAKQIDREAKAGYFAKMDWLARSADRRSNPKGHIPNAKSVICTAWSYGDHNLSEYIARYAIHYDYHNYVREHLISAWKKVDGGKHRAKFFVDSKPLAEEAFAARAGLGWIGKNSLLINPDYGSFFCLGLIVTELELDNDQPMKPLCGNCKLCQEKCPSKAIVAPGEVDCNKCISYLTTEHKEEFSDEQKEIVGKKIFGCDICQETCPYNRNAKEPKSVIPLKEINHKKIEDLKSINEEEFEKVFEGTPMERLGFDRFKRNCS